MIESRAGLGHDRALVERSWAAHATARNRWTSAVVRDLAKNRVYVCDRGYPPLVDRERWAARSQKIDRRLDADRPPAPDGRALRRCGRDAGARTGSVLPEVAAYSDARALRQRRLLLLPGAAPGNGHAPTPGRSRPRCSMAHPRAPACVPGQHRRFRISEQLAARNGERAVARTRAQHCEGVGGPPRRRAGQTADEGPDVPGLRRRQQGRCRSRGRPAERGRTGRT